MNNNIDLIILLTCIMPSCMQESCQNQVKAPLERVFDVGRVVMDHDLNVFL
jgi:hypothetical protein